MARSSAPPSKPRRGSSRPACSRRWWSSRPPWEREALEAARAGPRRAQECRRGKHPPWERGGGREEAGGRRCGEARRLGGGTEAEERLAAARPPRRAPIQPAWQSNRRRREGAGREEGAAAAHLVSSSPRPRLGRAREERPSVAFAFASVCWRRRFLPVNVSTVHARQTEFAPPKCTSAVGVSLSQMDNANPGKIIMRIEREEGRIRSWVEPAHSTTASFCTSRPTRRRAR